LPNYLYLLRTTSWTPKAIHFMDGEGNSLRGRRRQFTMWTAKPIHFVDAKGNSKVALSCK
jgi:hypothetical protein